MQRCTGARAVASVRRLSLGGWHVNHLVTLLGADGQREAVVLRRWARPGWQIKDPDFNAAREVAIYGVLAESRIPAPRLIAADVDGRACGVPAVLLTRLPGHPPPAKLGSLPEFLRQLAEPLPLMHQLGERARSVVPAFRSWHDFRQTRPPAWAQDRHAWERLIDFVATTPAPTAGWCFIHRDYHPENTLWLRGGLAGVVDWTSGSYGPPAVDLATMRVNLVRTQGIEAAEEFARMHAAVAGTSFTDQPYWDAVVLADAFGEDAHSPANLKFTAVSHVEGYLRRVLAHL